MALVENKNKEEAKVGIYVSPDGKKELKASNEAQASAFSSMGWKLRAPSTKTEDKTKK